MGEAGIAQQSGVRRRVLSARDILFFTIAGIIGIDQLPAAAAIGPSAIGWWIVTFVLFVIPYALIVAELGSAWPTQGGIYVWIREAFGAGWGTRSVWFYWVQLTIWLPSNAILAASIMAQLYFPGLAFWKLLLLSILFIALVAGLGSLKTDMGKWLPNLGAIVKIGLMLCIGIAGVIHVGDLGPANPMTIRDLMPNYSDGLKHLPILVFCMMGFELASGAADEMKNPERDLPRAIAISSIGITLLYAFATFGILAAVPSQDIILDEGLVETLKSAFGHIAGGQWIVTVLGTLIVFTLMTSMAAWTMGANRAIQESANDGQLPSAFSYEHPGLRTPVGANLLLALASTAIILLYGLMSTSVEELFWTLIAFSSVIFFIPYILMFLSFLRLRHIDPERHRPFRVPGGRTGAWLASVLSLFFVGQTILLFVYVPGDAFDPKHTVLVSAGSLVAILLGELLLRRSTRKERVSDEHPARPIDQATAGRLEPL